MSSKGQDNSRTAEPYRVGFPHNQSPPDLKEGEFPLLDRVLPLTEKIKKAVGQQGWLTVLNAVRKSEASGGGFEFLPKKIKKLILEAKL
jgi:hypothetical protein